MINQNKQFIFSVRIESQVANVTRKLSDVVSSEIKSVEEQHDSKNQNLLLMKDKRTNTRMMTEQILMRYSMEVTLCCYSSRF